MKAYGITNCGAVREENQDSFRLSLSDDGVLLTAVLCDGMGGAQAGSVASRLAADTFMSHAANSLDESSSANDIHTILREAANYANIRVYDRSFADFSCMGMGSTLVGLMANGRNCSIVNVGDSRAYIITKRRCEQITRDHSFVEELVSQGKITRAEAENHPKKNVITRAVGVEASVRSDLFDVRFSAGTRILLCSDGVSNLISGEEMRMICSNHDEVRDICDALVELALKRGAPDNITVILAQR